MVGPLTYKNPETGEYELRKGGFLRPGDDRDVYVATFEVEKVSAMKIKALYSALHDDLADDGWKDPIDGSDKFESLYWERHLDSGLREHHMWWRMVKYPHANQHGTGYMRWACKIDFQTLAVKDAEIAYKGKKKKVDSADLIVRLWFWVQWDFNDKFKDSIWSGLQRLFRRQLFKDELDSEWRKLHMDSLKIHRYIKTFLDMEESGEQALLFEEHDGYKDPFAP